MFFNNLISEVTPHPFTANSLSTRGPHARGTYYTRERTQGGEGLWEPFEKQPTALNKLLLHNQY